MATQPAEVFGEVIGYSAIVTHKGPYRANSVERMLCATAAECDQFVVRYRNGEFENVTPCVIVRGPFGDEEEGWYKDRSLPVLGMKLERLVCSKCDDPWWTTSEEVAETPRPYVCLNCKQAAAQKAMYDENPEVLDYYLYTEEDHKRPGYMEGPDEWDREDR
jgi:hypothetical protein